MTKVAGRKLQIHNVVVNHVSSNLRSYIVISLMFIVGVFIGVMFVNNTKDEQKEEISVYIGNYISEAKEQGSINSTENLKENIKSNILLAIGLWFAGTTLIGIPIVFGIILFRGFCLGYTISACAYVMGATKGIAFTLAAIFLQNIFFIPAILALGVSSTRLYKSVMKDKRKDNIKLEIVRHTVFSALMLAVLIIAAVVKVNISGEIIENVIKYF